MSFADELDNSIYLYSLPALDEYDSLVYLNKYYPNGTEEKMFVSEEIEESTYQQLKENHAVIAMTLTSLIIDPNTLSFSVSLPDLSYEDKENNRLVYYNAVAIICQSIDHADNRKLYPFNLLKKDSPSYISHEDYYFSQDLNLYFFKYSKRFPYNGCLSKRQIFICVVF